MNDTRGDYMNNRRKKRNKRIIIGVFVVVILVSVIGFFVGRKQSRLEIIQEKLLFIGSGDASMLETKEVFQHTLRCGANRIILIHNHPSGNPAPSVEDELITQKIKEMADCLEIEFIDHLIVGKHCFYSFASKKIYQNKED